VSIAESICRTLVRHRWPLLALGVMLTVVAYLPAQRLRFDQTIENMFAENDPLLEPYRLLKRTFGGNEVVLVIYTDRELLTPAGVQRVGQLGESLAKVAGVRSTLSLANTPLGPLITGDFDLAQRLRRLFTGFTMGADNRTAAVVCLLQPIAETRVSRAETVGQLRKLAEQHDPTALLAGEPVMVVEGFHYLDLDGRRLGWNTTVLLIITIFLCFRSIRWVVIPIVIVQATILWTQGLLVGLSLHLSMVSSMLVALITVVGIAMVLQLVVQYRDARWAGLLPDEALSNAGGKMLVPIVGAILADVVGFGSLVFSKVGPVADFGLMTALGSFLVLGTSATLMPGLTLAGNFDRDPRRAWGEGKLDLGLQRLAKWATRWPVLILLSAGILTALAIFFSTRLEVETDFTKNFRADSPIVQSYDFVETNLGGAGVWDVIVPQPSTPDWAFIDQVLKLEGRLRKELSEYNYEPGLTKVLSAADLLETVPGGRLLPLSVVWQQLEQQQGAFVSALSGQDPEHPEKKYFRIMLRARERQDARTKEGLIRAVQGICREEFPQSQVTGYFVLLTNLITSISGDQWFTFGLATVGVAILLLVLYRSVTLTLIALVPNAVPILMITGLMGCLGLKINMGAAMIAAVSMGLSVRSSILYITAFLRLRSTGLSVMAAVEKVHQSVGRAMIFTTIALVVGFSSLCLSDFVPTVYFGVLCSLTMFGGLLGNLLILPLLILLTSRAESPSQAS